MTTLQQTISPIDQSVFVERQLASQSHIEQTLSKAQSAWKAWRSTSVSQRQAICSKAIDLFIAQKDDIAREITWQMGRPIRYTPAEVNGFEERARYMIEIAEQALSPITLPEKAGFSRFILKEPLGVVLVIAPWNYPLLTAVNSIVPALMAGNAVLLKHSAQTPLCAERMVSAFLEAGLPEDLFSFIHMSHNSTSQLIKSPAIKHVAFTGSVSAGASIETATAGLFKSSGLELGGKDPAYIRHDAELVSATETVIDGAFFNSGQSCCGIERVYVHEAVYDEFLAAAIPLINAYKLGRPDDPNTTLGPMVRTGAADFVRQQIDEAITAGAVAHIDPGQFPTSQVGTPYLAPQLLTGVNHSMSIMTEESFGPVVGVQKVSSDAEALALMNDSHFGLTATLFTQAIDQGIALGEQLETGTFFINRCDYLDPALAWTGVKQSGRGCTLSELGYAVLTRPKSFHIKH